MAGITGDLSKEYRTELKEYLAAGGEAALKRAYGLGRRALAQEVGMLEITALHHQVLAPILTRADLAAGQKKKMLKQANDFLAECLSPFEMAQRGYRGSLAELNSLNARLENEVEKRTQALRESETLYRTLIEISPDAISLTDLEGKLILGNRQSALMHGYHQPDEVAGLNTRAYVAGEDLARVRESAMRVLNEGGIGRLEYALIRNDGTRVPVEVRVALVRDAAGGPTGFLGVSRDISERREAQLKLEAQSRRQAAVLELSQRALSGLEFNRLLQEAAERVALTLNVEFCALLELSEPAQALVLRAGVGWPAHLLGSVVMGAGPGSQPAVTLGAAEPVAAENMLQDRRFNSSAFLLEHNIVSSLTTTIPGQDGPYGILGAYASRRRQFSADEAAFLQAAANVLAMGIDNRRLLQTEARARQQAERDNERRLKALAIVSHELRTPLTSIKGFASTLLAEDVAWDDGQQQDFIRTIDEEADKLSDLIEQLLDLSKMDAGVFKITPTRQSLSALIEACMRHLQALGAADRLIFKIPPGLPEIAADTERVGQVLQNLVENAVKYAPAGTAITISAETQTDCLEISVADEGPGIPLAERENIFQAFHRVGDKATLKAKGAGLGLTICRRLVEAQGGHIWADGRTGPGAVFKFTLPLAEVAEKQGA